MDIFNCCIQNDTARKVLEEYATTLQTAFRQYRDLWEKFIKLQETYEECNKTCSFEICDQLGEYDYDDLKIVPEPISKEVEPENENNKISLNINKPKSIDEDVCGHFRTRYKISRAELPGHDCWQCKSVIVNYYQNLVLSKTELQKRKNKVSRHRYKFPKPHSLEGFWNPEFSDTMSE